MTEQQSRPDAPQGDGVRLSKVMAERGLASRREADEWIEAGWVQVFLEGAKGIAAAPGATQLEAWLKHDQFVSLQGLDFSADGKTLYVADYANGLWRVDLATRTPTLLAAPARATTSTPMNKPAPPTCPRHSC